MSILAHVLAALLTSGAAPSDKVLHLVQFSPITIDTYVLSQQVEVTNRALDIAVSEARSLYPACRVHVERQFELRDEEAFFTTIRDIARLPGERVVMGFSRTNFARIAARAAQGSPLVGISTASFSDQLKTLNPRFMTVSMPWTRQWELISHELTQRQCGRANTQGVFSYRDSLSQAFKQAYLDAGFTRTVEVDDFAAWVANKNDLAPIRCIVFGSSLPASIGPLTELSDQNWDGAVFGTGDWTYFTAEMQGYLARTPNRRLRLFASAVWTPRETRRAARWIEQHFRDVRPDPLLVHVHDAGMLALARLCTGADILTFEAARWRGYGLLRDYGGILPTGNLVSPMQLTEIR